MEWDLMTIWHVARSFWVVWLIIVFVAIGFWAFRPKNKKRFEDDAMIIFKKDEKNGGPAHG